MFNKIVQNSLFLGCFIGASIAFANIPTPLEADNSAQNERDRAGQTLTPQDQVKGSPLDVKWTRAARQRLVKDRTLSSNAKNIKIITIDSVMTLRGPVKTMAEKEKVLAHAKSISGKIKIIDHLEITQQ